MRHVGPITERTLLYLYIFINDNLNFGLFMRNSIYSILIRSQLIFQIFSKCSKYCVTYCMLLQLKHFGKSGQYHYYVYATHCVLHVGQKVQCWSHLTKADSSKCFLCPLHNSWLCASFPKVRSFNIWLHNISLIIKAMYFICYWLSVWCING